MGKKIFEDFDASNFRRMKILSIVFVFFGVFLLITDYSSFNPWDEKVTGIYKVLDVCFTILFFIAALYFWSAKGRYLKFNNGVVKITVACLILWAVLISGIDFSGEGFSTYIAALLLSLLYLHFKPIFSMSLIWISTVLLLVIIYFQPQSHFHPYFASVIFMLLPISIISTLISLQFYREKVEALNIFYKNEMLMQELERAKNTLSSEVEQKTSHLVEANVELLRTKENAEESEEKYRALYEYAPLPYQSLDEEGRFKDINPAWLSTLGYKREEIIGRPYRDFLHPDWKSHFEKNFPAFKKRGYVRDVQFKIRHKDGHYIDISFEGCIGYNKDGSFKQTYCVFQDITHKKQVEEAMLAAKQKAEESDRLKSAFLANMSHEIRTPMNGILGFTELLLKPDLSDETREKYIEIIHKSGERMLNTVNDIIEISKIEAGLAEVKKSEINVVAVLKSLIDFFQPQVQHKGIAFSFDNERLPLYLHTDLGKFESILTNLIKNAIKFTDNGKVSVGFEIQEKFIQFCVKDTGMGVPPNRIHAIFNRFEQADIEDTKVMQGSGLGLAIAKSYVEMLGGRIWVESVEWKGSSFYFTLPLDSEDIFQIAEVPVRHKEVNVKSINALKVLIVEDEDISADYLEIILSGIAQNIVKTNSGEKAIELMKTNPDIDVILMDIKMPGINGFEATRSIREFNKEVIIIAQTAYALSGDRENVMAAGCNDYISKPVKKEVLQSLIEKYFG